MNSQPIIFRAEAENHSLVRSSFDNFSHRSTYRLALFVLLCLAEWGPCTYFFHKELGPISPLRVGMIFALRIGMLFTTFFLVVSYFKTNSFFQYLSSELTATPIGWMWLTLHVAAFLSFIGLSVLPFTGNGSPIGFYSGALWYVTGILAIVFSGLVFIPLKLVLQVARNSKHIFLGSLAAAIVIAWVTQFIPIQLTGVWAPLTDLTFGLVRAMLHLVAPNVSANRATMTFGTPAFQVEILPGCIGYEGNVLIVIFTGAWMILRRRELRFPQALLLMPAAMLTMWIANAVRITALVLIGVAGAPAVAITGFHSQTGWIMFNCVAVGFVLAAQRLPRISVQPDGTAVCDAPSQNSTAVYLMPFVLILAATMVSRAASGGFEWLYPLRFVAAAAALWYFRHEYGKLDWKFGWFAPVIGSLVFAIWLALDRLSGAQPESGVATGLAALPASARIAWLAFRVGAAVITVPIAEELAFRGFLNRRLISPDFTSVGFREFTMASLLISSLAFGVLHGQRWIAGTLAGLCYAAAMLRRGRIGDAVAAHASTNFLLAIWVLYRGAWNLW